MDPLLTPLDRDGASDKLGFNKAWFFEHMFATREEPVPFQLLLLKLPAVDERPS